MFSFSDTHTENESTDKTEAQTSSNFRGNSKLFRKEMRFSAKFCDICIYIVCVYVYTCARTPPPPTHTSISIFNLGSLSFCLENTEDVGNLEMGRKEVC